MSDLVSIVLVSSDGTTETVDKSTVLQLSKLSAEDMLNRTPKTLIESMINMERVQHLVSSVVGNDKWEIDADPIPGM